MPVAEITDGDIRVTTTYHERHLMAELPGARYRRELGAWVAPLSWATCVTLRGLFGNQLTVGEALKEWAWKTRRERIEPVMKIRGSLFPIDDNDPLADAARGAIIDKVETNSYLKLFPYQRADVEFLAINQRALLANPPGLGKTGVTIRTLQVLQASGKDPFPALIVCPNSLKFTVWRDGFRQWAPEVTVVVVDGSATVRRTAIKEAMAYRDGKKHRDGCTDVIGKSCTCARVVVVINWDSVRLHSKLAQYGNMEMTDQERLPKELNELGHKTAIFDEAHRLKDPRSKQTRAAWAVAHQATYRYTLTGTPAANDIGDLWSVLHCVEPTWFPARTKFLDRYATMSHSYWGGAQVIGIDPVNRKELFTIVDPLMRRLPKEAALPQLPPKLPVQYRHTKMTAGQQKAYDQMRDMMVAELNEILVAPNPLSKLTRLLQFAAASAELSEPKTRIRLEEFLVTLKQDDIDAMYTKHGDEIFGSEELMMVAIREHYSNDERKVTKKRRPAFLDGSKWFEAGQVISLHLEMEEVYQDVILTDPSSKVDDMIDLLDEMDDEPLVVGAVSRQLIELAAKRLTKHGISHMLITGAQTPLERQEAVDAFQAGKIRVILLTLGAGAEGITLTRANTMLFMQRSYSEVQNTQAEDRVHRIGSEGHAEVRIIEQITPDSIEENKHLVLQDKRARIEDIVRDKEALLRLLGEPKTKPKRKAKAE